MIFPFFICSADHDGCLASAFHAKCDNRYPLIAVASNMAGYVFGGYAPIPWFSPSSFTTLSAPSSFLFRLRKTNERDYTKFAAEGTNEGVSSRNDMGPGFGNASGWAFNIMNNSNITKKSGENFFTCPMSVNFNYGYRCNSQDNNALHGEDNRLINIEVYTVEG